MPSYLETSVEIAREAGALLSKYFERRVTFELKGEHDLVTEADRASEQLVIERLSSHFPSHSIVAEEGGGHIGSSEYCWYVDPLDGTTNFAHGFPMYNITMALEQSGELIAGATGKVPEPNVVEVVERGANDLALRQQPGLKQVEQARQQFSPRQVARGPEQDKEMRHDGGIRLGSAIRLASTVSATACLSSAQHQTRHSSARRYLGDVSALYLRATQARPPGEWSEK